MPKVKPVTPATVLRDASPAHRLREERLIASNVALVVWSVKIHLHIHDGHPDFEDAVSTGTIALIKAARGYDPLKYTTFSTYASRAIMNELFAWASKEWSYGLKGAENVQDKRRRPLSIDIGGKIINDGTGLAEFVELASPERPELVDHGFVTEEINTLLGKIPDRMRQVIELRHFQQLTLQEIGAQFGLSKERIRQLYSRGLVLLRLATLPSPKYPKGQIVRRCAHCHDVIPNVGKWKYCRPGYGCKAHRPQRPLVFGKADKTDR